VNVVTLINPPSKLHYLRNVRSPALLGCGGCASKYNLRGHPALRGLGSLRAIGDATGAGVPAGTVLAYTATWPDSKLQLKNPDAVQAQIQSDLAQVWGVVIDKQWHAQSDYFNLSGQQSMTLQVHTMSDYGASNDIQSIIDGEIYKATQSMPVSTIRVVQQVTGPADTLSPTQQLPASTAAAVTAAQAGYQDAIARGDSVSASQFAAQIQQLTGTNPMGTGAGITGWLASNWMWLAAAVGGVIVAREVL
jgi:hypothetical protein